MSDNANNTEKYPRPPFVDQPQSPPGLAEEMKPQPDHGELSYVGSGRLAGKRALITGGDSGIGRAVAIAFAREGADVAINYLPEEESDAETVVALIQAEGRKAVAIPGDVRDESFCETLVEQAASELGGLDILVNNAGRQQYCESLEELTTADFDATFKTNVYAAFWITKAALRHPSPPARCGAPTAATACCKSLAAARPQRCAVVLRQARYFCAESKTICRAFLGTFCPLKAPYSAPKGVSPRRSTIFSTLAAANGSKLG